MSAARPITANCRSFWFCSPSNLWLWLGRLSTRRCRRPLGSPPARHLTQRGSSRGPDCSDLVAACWHLPPLVPWREFFHSLNHTTVAAGSNIAEYQLNVHRRSLRCAHLQRRPYGARATTIDLYKVPTVNLSAELVIDINRRLPGINLDGDIALEAKLRSVDDICRRSLTASVRHCKARPVYAKRSAIDVV